MATVKQLNTVLTSVAGQMYGSSALAVTNLQSLISLGDRVMATDTDKDLFVSTLSDMIELTIFRKLDFESSFPGMIRHPYEMGAAFRKIDVQPLPARENTAWKVGTEGFTPNPYPVMKPELSQSIFSDFTTYRVGVTVPDDLLNTAFHSYSDAERLISYMIDSQELTIRLNTDHMERMAVNNLLAEVTPAAGQTSSRVINLATEYNTLHSYTSSDAGYITPGSALAFDNKDFMQFVWFKMLFTLNQMKQPSVHYSGGSKIRASLRDNLHVIMLGYFTAKYQAVAQSNTYWKELTELPYYTEVPFWQASDDLSFAKVSKISIIPSSSADGTTAVNIENVIGAYIDREAVGVGLDKKKPVVARNALEEYTDYARNITTQYFNDTSENVVYFTIN